MKDYITVYAEKKKIGFTYNVSVNYVKENTSIAYRVEFILNTTLKYKEINTFLKNAKSLRLKIGKEKTTFKFNKGNFIFYSLQKGNKNNEIQLIIEGRLDGNKSRN